MVAEIDELLLSDGGLALEGSSSSAILGASHSHEAPGSGAPVRMEVLRAKVGVHCRRDTDLAATERVNVPGWTLVGLLSVKCDQELAVQSQDCRAEVYFEGVGWQPFGNDSAEFSRKRLDKGMKEEEKSQVFRVPAKGGSASRGSGRSASWSESRSAVMRGYDSRSERVPNRLRSSFPA